MKIENDSQLLSEFNKAYERGSLKLAKSEGCSTMRAIIIIKRSYFYRLFIIYLHSLMLLLA